MTEHDGGVVIVGGGIGGLTAALCLRHHGIDCTVYERAPELQEIGAGLGMWPAALAVYDHLGLGARVRDLAGPWETAGIRRADGRFLVRYTADQLGRRLGEPAIGVHRGELQRVLADALPPGAVRTGRECRDIDVTPDQVQVRFGDGTSATGSVLIAADGRRSVVRRRLFTDRELRDCAAVSWRGVTAGPVDPAWGAFAGETWGGDVVFGILPLSDGRVSWYGAAVEFTDGGSRTELVDRFGHLHSPIPELIAATDDDGIWRDRIDDLRPIRRWTDGRVALLGDAAHPMTPDLGQGACQAIRDAWSVASELAVGDDPASALRRYQRARRRRAAWVTRAAGQMCRGGSYRSAPLRRVQEAGIGLVPAPVLLRGLQLIVG